MKLRISLFLILLMLIATACNSGIKGAKNWPVEDFTFTDHEGNQFGLNDLEGKIWVADFIFTNCDSVCLPMTANMAELQKRLKEEELENIELVSFSVDPEFDNPEALKEFGEYFEIDFENYHFLTGYSQEFIEGFALDNFKEIVDKPEEEEQVIHGTRFFLVNQEGSIVKYYSGLSDIPFEEIINDIKTLQ